MSDICERLRKEIPWEQEVGELLEEAIAEIARLRSDNNRRALLEAGLRDGIARYQDAIRRLAEQDATLSVCDGAVTVTMDFTLADAEREAVNDAIYLCEAEAGLFGERAAATKWATCAATLRGLLERLGHTGSV